MKGNFKAGTEEFQTMQEFYDLVWRYYTQENTVEYWLEMGDACSDFIRKHQTGKVGVLAKILGHALVDFLEETK